jgi:hypothetical protein
VPFAFTQSCLSPCRSNSPSTAAPGSVAAANSRKFCAKIAFLAFLPQLSSPLFPVTVSNPLRHFDQRKGLWHAVVESLHCECCKKSPFAFVTEGNPCGAEFAAFAAFCDRRECLWHADFHTMGTIGSFCPCAFDDFAAHCAHSLSSPV